MVRNRNDDHSNVHFVFNTLNERLYYIIFISCVWAKLIDSFLQFARLNPICYENYTE